MRNGATRQEKIIVRDPAARAAERGKHFLSGFALFFKGKPANRLIMTMMKGRGRISYTKKGGNYANADRRERRAGCET